MDPPLMFDRGDGVRLAARHLAGRGPTILFLPGYMSDMEGTKAQHLWTWAQSRGRACLLFDYSGCGRSEGRFKQGTIRRWAADALALADAVAAGPLLPVGSSMGGWIMLHCALACPEQIAALVGIAAAPDFTRWGLSLAPEETRMLAERGFVERASIHAPQPYRYHRALIEDAPHACLLDAPIPIHAPVRLLHGTADTDVPWEISLRLMQQLQSADVQLTLVKDGDHRLSAPPELDLLTRTLEDLDP